MVKINNKKVSSANSLVSLDNSIREFEIFKSRVANAVLDYMESQCDLDLVCLEKSSLFLNSLSAQMEKVFDDQNQAVKDQNELFEIGDDLFSTYRHNESNSIH
tara:strand:- start:379 stop:687 length:309 start_codon:yes stop_codon:yes gene_type:complete